MSDPRTENAAHAKARAQRNVVIALGLVAFVIVVFVVTLIKMGFRGG